MRIQTDLPPYGDVVCANPPFNGALGKQLYPEVFLRHIFDLWGSQMPTVMFVPMGLRLNQRRKSGRDSDGCGTAEPRSRRLSLSRSTFFRHAYFHAEILILNINGIEPHYFLPEEALQ